MKGLLFLLLGTLVLLPGSRAQITISEKEKIDDLFQFWDKENSPGAALGIIKDGKLIYSRGYGMANLDYNIPITADSKFYIASVAKQFTAACIALLHLDGELSLDDDIRKYVPEIPVYEEVITIRNLVHHTSGLRDYLSMMYMSGRSFEDYFNNEDGIELLSRQKGLNFLPNEEFLYCNSGYILMAEIVNRVSGMSMRAYAHQKIFEPLNMTDTYFNDDHSQVLKDRVVSYTSPEQDVFKRFVQNFDGHGDGGMITTVDDMLLWDQNFYHKKVGGEAFIKLMLSQTELKNGYKPEYAFGIEHANYMGLPTIEHGGSFLGFRHHYLRFPDQGVSIMVFSNASNLNAYSWSYQVSDVVLADDFVKVEMPIEKKERSEIPVLTLSNNQLLKYCGGYYYHKENFSRKIYLKDDTLRLHRMGNNESPIVPIGQDQFKMLGFDLDITVRFELMDGQSDRFVLQVGDNAPQAFDAYEPASYTIEDLQGFEGTYHSSELGCDYNLKLIGDSLRLILKGEEYSTLTPIMDNLFANDFVDFISFNPEDKEEFVIKSGRVRGVLFQKK